MDAEFKSLERKLSQFVELCQRLRDDNKQLADKIGTATNRLESLLNQLPEEEA